MTFYIFFVTSWSHFIQNKPILHTFKHKQSITKITHLLTITTQNTITPNLAISRLRRSYPEGRKFESCPRNHPEANHCGLLLFLQKRSLTTRLLLGPIPQISAVPTICGSPITAPFPKKVMPGYQLFSGCFFDVNLT